jgi:hypothetical protein
MTLTIGAGISVGPGISFSSSVPGDPYIANVISLIPMTGTVGAAPAVTYGTTNTLTPYGTPPLISAAQSNWGTTSTAFGGNGFLYLSVLPAMTGDLTWEAFIYPTIVAGSPARAIFSNYTASGRFFFIENGALYWFNSNAPTQLITGAAVTVNQWHHVAISRTSGTTKLFLNGQQTGTVVVNDNSNFSGASTNLAIGGFESTPNDYEFNGYMNDVRITVGVGRYTSNFTPATQPFPAF